MRAIIAEPLLLGETDELPVVGEGAAVAVAEVLEDDLAGVAEAGWHLEQIDRALRQPADLVGRSSRVRSLEDVNKIGSNVDFDLLEALQQGRLEGDKELLVFPGVFDIHDKA